MINGSQIEIKNMSSLTPEYLPHYTYDDYTQWEGVWELIQGIAYAMTPAPIIKHQRISNNIAWLLNDQLKECEKCMALLPVDWKISEDTVVQPDNLVVCYEAMGRFITKAPSLIFEILSKSTAQKDLHLKYELYEKEGVEYYVIIDPEDEVAKVYELKGGRYVKMLDATDEAVSFDLKKCNFTFDFARIWK